MTDNMKEIERIANEAWANGVHYGVYVEQLDMEKEQKKNKKKPKSIGGKK